jgi:hypothetical protein
VLESITNVNNEVEFTAFTHCLFLKIDA